MLGTVSQRCFRLGQERRRSDLWNATACNSSHLLFFINLYMVKLFLLFANNVSERPENVMSTPPAKHVAHALTGSGAITGSYRRRSCFPAAVSPLWRENRATHV